jgi:hypothetical protein
VDEETEFDGWASLGARRQTEDEMLIQRYASGEGRGLDMRPVRGFVQHVRRDLGPKAIICDVKMTVQSTGHEVVAWYYFPDPENGSPAATPVEASVTDVPTRPAEPPAAMPSAASNSLASVDRSFVAAPPSFAGSPSAPAPARLTQHATT